MVALKHPALLAATLLAAAALPLTASAGEVSLTGQGLVQYNPDSARLQFSVSAEHRQPQQASAQVAELMDKWRKAIRPWQDQLQDYSDASVNHYTRTLPVERKGDDPERIAVASQTVSFSISDLELLNPILEQASKLGMQYNLGAHQFFHSDEQGLEQQALARAIEDARQRCEFVARQLDKTCGEVVTININGGHRPMPVMMMAEAKASRDTVSSIGPREIQTSVSATFELD